MMRSASFVVAKSAASADALPVIVSLIVWLSVGIAFSPVVVEWIADWPNIFSAGSLLLPVAMLLRLAFAPRRAAPSWLRHIGVACVILGVVIELFGVLAGASSIARFGPALAIAGVLMWAHRWPFHAAVIALGCVPIPAFMYVITTPTVEVAYGLVASELLAFLGVVVVIHGPLVGTAPSILELQPAYNGVQVSALLALVGWYRGVRGPGRDWEPLRNASLGLLLGPATQLVATVLAVGLATAGFAGLARVWMEHGLWISVALGGFGWAERSSRRAQANATSFGDARA